MFSGDIFECIHDQLIVIHGQVSFFIHRSNFILAGRDFIVPCFGRNAQFEEFFLDIMHIGRNSLFNAAEILILQLLTFGRGSADDGSAAQHQIRTFVIIIHID